jgi:hypothetical protein
MRLVRPAVVATILGLAAGCRMLEATDGPGVAEEAVAGSGARDAGAGAVRFHQVFLSDREGGDGGPPWPVYPEVKSVVVGPDSDLWITGTFRAPLHIGDTELTSVGSTDVFVARLDPSGQPRWSARLGGADEDVCRGLVLDAEGNGLVALQPSDFARVLTVVKLGRGGDVLWQREALRLDAGDFVDVEAIVSDRAGGMAVVGKLDGRLHAGSSSVSGGIATFLARVDGDGEARWGTRVGPGADELDMDVAVDVAGNALIGEGNSKADRIRIAKVDAAGKLLFNNWFRGRIGTVSFGSVAADPEGNILVSGAGAIDFGDGAAPVAGAWIAKLDPAGRRIWQKEAGFGRVASDSAGNVLYANFNSAAKLDASGAWVWKWLPPIHSTASVGAVAVDPAGRLVAAGVFQGSYDFGNGPVESGERPAVFVVGFAP